MSPPVDFFSFVDQTANFSVRYINKGQRRANDRRLHKQRRERRKKKLARRGATKKKWAAQTIAFFLPAAKKTVPVSPHQAARHQIAASLHRQRSTIMPQRVTSKSRTPDGRM